MPIPGTSFDHDPASLPPSLGGRILKVNTAGGPGWGRFDQRPVAAHPGVSAVELGAPPARRLAGPVRANLATEATGADNADWVCTLCVRDGDGALLNLCEGIARAAAGRVRGKVDLGNICVELPPGRRALPARRRGELPALGAARGVAPADRRPGSTLELTAAGDV